MPQHVEPGPVQHQPWDQPREFLDREGDLVHRNGMRPDRLVMPVADPTGETSADRLTQPRRDLLRRRRVVIDVRVIAADLPWIDKIFRHRVLLSHPRSSPAEYPCQGPAHAASRPNRPSGRI